MTPAEAAELLTLAGAFDRRTIGKTDAIAWADALDGLSPADCAEAIRAHFRTSTDYLMPVHVRNGVKAIRAERIRTTNSALLEPHNIDPADIEAYQAERRRLIELAASGQALPVEPLNPARDVTALLQTTARQLPKMPAALPQVDLAKKRARPVEAVAAGSPVDGPS